MVSGEGRIRQAVRVWLPISFRTGVLLLALFYGALAAVYVVRRRATGTATPG